MLFKNSMGHLLSLKGVRRFEILDLNNPLFRLIPLFINFEKCLLFNKTTQEISVQAKLKNTIS